MQLISSRGEGHGGGSRSASHAPAAVHQHHDEYSDSRGPMIDNEREASGFNQDEIPF